MFPSFFDSLQVDFYRNSFLLIQSLLLDPSAAPPNIIVGNTGSRTVTVNWSVMPKNSTNGPIIDYEVKLEYFQRGNPTFKTTATTTLNVDIGSLFPYTVYNVTVRAKNKVGFGPYSQMKSVTTNEDGLLQLFISPLICYISSFFLFHLHSRLLLYLLLRRPVNSVVNRQWRDMS